ncbi:MAG: hypothetical protein ACRC62_30585 [Microcoleus sp.]
MRTAILNVASLIFDILTAVKWTVIPKPHDLGFCFIAPASTRFRVLWSYGRSTDYPR